MMALVGRLKQNTTKFGQSWFVTGTQLNCDWCEEKVGSEVLRKYGVRLK